MSDSEKLTEGTLLSHLLELRTRLVRATAAVLIAFIPCAIYANDLFTLLARPLLAKLPDGGSLVATSVMGPFTTPFKLAFFVSLFITVPYILFETWGFVAPGLYRKEKRFAVPLVVSSILLFYIGMAFAYFLVFPNIFAFLAATTPQGVKMMTDINDYVGFAMTMFFSFGIAFEVPIAVVLLALTGVVSVEKLGSNRGYVIIGIFVIAAVLTPTTDAISQCAMAIPMWLLYEAGVIVARLMVRGRKKDAEEKDADKDAEKKD